MALGTRMGEATEWIRIGGKKRKRERKEKERRKKRKEKKEKKKNIEKGNLDISQSQSNS